MILVFISFSANADLPMPRDKNLEMYLDKYYEDTSQIIVFASNSTMRFKDRLRFSLLSVDTNEELYSENISKKFAEKLRDVMGEEFNNAYEIIPYSDDLVSNSKQLIVQLNFGLQKTGQESVFLGAMYGLLYKAELSQKYDFRKEGVLMTLPPEPFVFYEKQENQKFEQAIDNLAVVLSDYLKGTNGPKL